MRTRILEQGPEVRRVILLVLIAGVPVFVLRTGLDPFNVPKLGLLMAGVSVVACIRIAEIIQGAPAEGLRRLLFPALAFSVPLMLASAFSPYRGWTLFGAYPRFQGLVPYLAAVLLGVLIADAFADRPIEAARAFLVAGGLVGGYGLIQVIGIDPLAWAITSETGSAAISTLGNSNFTGGFLAVVLPVAVAVWLLEGGQWKWSDACLALTAVGLLVTQSRGGYAGGVAGAAIVGGFVLARRWRWALASGLAVAAIAGTLVIGAVAMAMVSPDSDFSKGDFIARGHWWTAASGMAFDSPVFGRGPNTYAFEGIQHRTREDALERENRFSDDPHSVFFSLFAGAGVLGALEFLAVAGWSVQQGLRVQPENLLAVGFLGAIVAYFIQSFVSIDELTLRVALWTALGGLAVSVLPVPKVKRRQQAKKPPARRKSEPLRWWPALVPPAVAALAALVWSIGFVQADARVASAAKLFASGEPIEGKREFDGALGFRDDYEYRERYGNLLSQIVVNSKGEAEGFFEAAVETYSYVYDFPDLDPTLQYARDLTEMSEFVAVEADQIVDLYKRAIDIDTFNPTVRLKAAEAYRELGRPEDAIKILVDFAPIAGDSQAEIWATLALALAESGDREGALEALENALAIDPNNKTVREAEETLKGKGKS